MDEILSQIFQVGFFAAMIRIATPLLFATLGELFAERSGVLNLGVECMMVMGAVTGFGAAQLTGSAYLGVVAAIICGSSTTVATSSPNCGCRSVGRPFASKAGKRLFIGR